MLGTEWGHKLSHFRTEPENSWAATLVICRCLHCPLPMAKYSCANAYICSHTHYRACTLPRSPALFSPDSHCVEPWLSMVSTCLPPMCYLLRTEFKSPCPKPGSIRLLGQMISAKYSTLLRALVQVWADLTTAELWALS